MNVRPLHDRILVHRLDEGEQRVGGIIIPDTAKEKPQQGTIKFALVRLPDTFIADDKLPILPTERWFENREAAIAALPELLNREA